MPLRTPYRRKALAGRGHLDLARRHVGRARAGNVTFDDFYADWAPRQMWLPSTRANADLSVGSVPFGDLPFKSIDRSHVETWVKSASERWAPSTVKTRFVIVRSVFRAGVADRVIGADPCIGVTLPRRRKGEAMQIQSVE